MSEVEFATSTTARQPGGFKDVSKAGRVPTQEELDAVRKQRQEHFDKLRAEASLPDFEAPATDVVAREDIESIELTLPNGLQIEYGPPRNVSMNLRIASLLGDQSSVQVLVAIAQTILCVRKINGKPMPTINTIIELTKFANLIGDDGMDILANEHRECWPPLTKADLPAIKKNLRPI